VPRRPGEPDFVTYGVLRVRRGASLPGAPFIVGISSRW